MGHPLRKLHFFVRLDQVDNVWEVKYIHYTKNYTLVEDIDCITSMSFNITQGGVGIRMPDRRLVGRSSHQV